ncbi:terminase small subunit [Tenacibaculum caenipelagi]|uniref:Phage terminase small subunit n=1 Tax=Tenacibaculum caenipelagi TaxID=1325435 RepID=A0A4R6TDT0_9FLAO|nr:terminase small subunit [Tenacibaculum caenipelagi]TDQ27638.1 phage terminase small subunit [Tenacibaculum caenipelagi]
MKESTLEKYKLIIDEWFVNGFNGTKAYQKFYPSVSEETAKVNFSKILTITNVLEYVSERQKQNEENSRLKGDDIIKELEAMAMLDVTNIVTVGSIEIPYKTKDEEGNDIIETMTRTGVVIKNLDELTPVQRRSIVSIKETKNGIHIEFFNKEKAYEMLAKHKGLYGEHNYQKNEKLTKEERKARIQELRKKIQSE